MSSTFDLSRAEGAREVRILGGSLIVLMVLGYLSFTKKDEAVTAEKVTILEAKPEQIQGISMITRTQTVSFERRKGPSGDEFPWFGIEANKKKRGFKGNKSTPSMLEGFAPFTAIRTLGAEVGGDQLAETKLDKPDAKLILRIGNSDKVYEIGGRTFGTRDYYVRAKGGKEIFLVASKTLADFEFPESRFMQRQLKEIETKDTTSVMLKAGKKEKRFIQQNRLSSKDAFWAAQDAPDAKNETFENYLHKVESLAATGYAEESVLASATKVLEVSWHEEEKPKDVLTIYRAGEPGKEKYYGVSTVTVLPVELPKTSTEQVEQDLASVLAD
ncbi:MAG: DUF4340 domain-containing protein [Myxococcota bacterium]